MTTSALPSDFCLHTRADVGIRPYGVGWHFSIRVPDPNSNVFKWQFENTATFHFALCILHFRSVAGLPRAANDRPYVMGRYDGRPMTAPTIPVACCPLPVARCLLPVACSHNINAETVS